MSGAGRVSTVALSANTAVRRWPRTLWRAAVRVAAALGFCMLFATVTPFVDWYAARLAGRQADGRGDVLIVLGADTTGSALGLTSYYRCLGVLWAYRESPYREIVLSGAGAAPQMRDYLVSQGVPAPLLRLENASRSTRENAVYTARLLGGDARRKVLVTSEYHMWRAVRAFRRAGVNVSPWPVPDARKGGWRRRWPAFLDEGVETVKIGFYWMRGWI